MKDRFLSSACQESRRRNAKLCAKTLCDIEVTSTRDRHRDRDNTSYIELVTILPRHSLSSEYVCIRLKENIEEAIPFIQTLTNHTRVCE